jgi:hypothetical protein
MIVQLAALGKSDRAPTLPNIQITPETIDAIGIVCERTLGSSKNASNLS